MENSSCHQSTRPSRESGGASRRKLVQLGLYKLHETLGKGNFAVVKLATHNITQSKVAIKIIDKSRLDERNLQKLYREVEIMSKLNHPHIVKLYQVIETADNLYLVTEYAAGGEVFSHLLTLGHMNEKDACRIFRQILSAVAYCHANNVVHRDLKAENVLLDENGDIKLADFGFSNFYTPGEMLKTWCGSPPYAAPELFSGQEYDGTKSDVWSLGVVLYVMVTAQLPFDAPNLSILKQHILFGKFRIPFYMSNECENLIRNMLIVDPNKRLTIEQIRSHRWLILHSSGSDPFPVTSNRNESEPNNAVVIEIQSYLSTMPREKITDAITNKKLGTIGAMYNLLCDKYERTGSTLQAPITPRRGSITTGVVERFVPQVAALVDYDSLYEQFDDTQMETDIASPPVPQTNVTATRRHTVGPGDESHSQVMDAHGLQNYQPTLLTPHLNMLQPPNANLLFNLPQVQYQHPQNFYIPDQKLLQPPIALGARPQTRMPNPSPTSFNNRFPLVNLCRCFSCSMYYVPVPSGPIQPTNPLREIEFPLPRHPPPKEIKRVNVCTRHASLFYNGPVTEHINGFGRRASDGGANFQMCYQRVDGVYSQPGSQAEVTTDTKEGTQYGQSQPIPGALRGDETEETHHRCLSEQPVTPQTGRTRRSGILTVTDRPPVISPELVREVEARMRREYTPPACPYSVVHPPIRHSRIKQVPTLSPVKESRRSAPGNLKDTVNHLTSERFSPARRINDSNIYSSSNYSFPEHADPASPIRNLQQEYHMLQKSSKVQGSDMSNNIQITCSSSSRSPSSSPPMCTSPTVSSGSCSPTLQRLSLQTGGHCSASSSPTHCCSLNDSNDKPLDLRIQHTSQTPSPTSLGIIQEEIPPGSLNGALTLSLMNPRISITDELGRISLSEELDATLLINQNLPLSNAQPVPSKPSIVRGIGKNSTYATQPPLPLHLPVKSHSMPEARLDWTNIAIRVCQEIGRDDLVTLIQNTVPKPNILDNDMMVFPNGLQVQLQFVDTTLRMRRVSGDQTDYNHLCMHLSSTLS